MFCYIEVTGLYSAIRDGSEGNESCGRNVGIAKDTSAVCLPVPDSPISYPDGGVVYRRRVEFCAPNMASRQSAWVSPCKD